MTRINANIKPKDLIDQHLIAEYREIVRIPNIVKKKEVDISKIPASFRLGTGHVLFFYNKLKFLHKRFLLLKKELDNRGIINNMKDEMFKNLPVSLYHDIEDDNLLEANQLIIDRIIERISTMKRKPTISGIPINKSNYFLSLKKSYEFTKIKK